MFYMYLKNASLSTLRVNPPHSLLFSTHIELTEIDLVFSFTRVDRVLLRLLSLAFQPSER